MQYVDMHKYRDVRSSQNMERGEREKPKSKVPYLLMTGGLTALSYIIGTFIWKFVSNLMYGFDLLNKSEDSVNTVMTYPWFGFRDYSFKAQLLLLAIVALIGFILYYQFVMVTWKSNNEASDHTDINTYEGDSYIMFPEEMVETLDWFPDAGAHSSVSPTSLVSHVVLTNKGLNHKVDMYDRYDKDTIENINGKQVMRYKGDVKRDRNGQMIIKSVPIIDEEFGEDLFTASDIPVNRKDLRRRFNASEIRYNPGVKDSRGRMIRKDRDKLNYDTVKDLIKNDWELPLYEFQRPAGAYLVDTAPVNTMVLAITRAGKGQTFIEPTLDMWTREKRLNNILVNDPKGELLRMFFVPATVRGYEVVQFNLIKTFKTDISNPLAGAIVAARDGDFAKAAAVVENVGDIFFPKDAGDEPMWPNAANNAFKRTIFGLIDFYLEEEYELRERARIEHIDARKLDLMLDELWGKVTLYNAYRFFITLASQKVNVPKDDTFAYVTSDDPDSIWHIGDRNSKASQEYKKAMNLYGSLTSVIKNKTGDNEGADKRKAKKPEVEMEERDLLTHFFDATNKLPRTPLRTFVQNADASLRAMAGSERTIASVYGITLTAMNFFTDPKVRDLTSGRPSQSFDNESLSFPRRLGVRFSPEYVKRMNLAGKEAYWTAYKDPLFKEQLDYKLFNHKQTIEKIGWAMFYFDGKFSEYLSKKEMKRPRVYLKLQIKAPGTQRVIKTFYFELELTYKRKADGGYYLKDVISKKKILLNGVLREIRGPKQRKQNGEKVQYMNTVLPYVKRDFSEEAAKKFNNEDTDKNVYSDIKTSIPAIMQTKVNYTEKPKMIFLVTPPHLMSYAKLLLIAIKQMADVGFDSSYVTKPSQKPLYATRYMLDELGNLQSEGKGIPNLPTLLSIGLGQSQQFTLILQTMQQLLDVYGQSVDKVITGNTNNIVFLKSTDTDMISTLSKMSGTRHDTVMSKTITQDNANMFERNDARVTKGVNVQEVPVIKENDFITLSPRNSIIFRAGSTPVWNRNEMILPMSYALLGHTIMQPGVEPYTLQTIPSNSSVMSFDVERNTPDFYEMLRKRCEQARWTKEVERDWLKANGYGTSDLDHTAMYTNYVDDGESLSKDIMAEINARIAKRHGKEPVNKEKRNIQNVGRSNDEFSTAYEKATNEQVVNDKKIYANQTIAKSQLVRKDGVVIIADDLRRLIAKALLLASVRKSLKREGIKEENGMLYGPDGDIFASPDEHTWKDLNIDGKTFDFNELTSLPNDMQAYEIQDAFIQFLASKPDWTKMSSFNNIVAELVRADEQEAYDNENAIDMHTDIAKGYGG